MTNAETMGESPNQQQLDELEVLQSVYPEIQSVTPPQPPFTLQFKLSLDALLATSIDYSDNDGIAKLVKKVILVVSFPANYPEAEKLAIEAKSTAAGNTGDDTADDDWMLDADKQDDERLQTNIVQLISEMNMEIESYLSGDEVQLGMEMGMEILQFVVDKTNSLLENKKYRTKSEENFDDVFIRKTEAADENTNPKSTPATTEASASSASSTPAPAAAAAAATPNPIENINIFQNGTFLKALLDAGFENYGNNIYVHSKTGRGVTIEQDLDLPGMLSVSCDGLHFEDVCEFLRLELVAIFTTENEDARIVSIRTFPRRILDWARANVDAGLGFIEDEDDDDNLPPEDDDFSIETQYLSKDIKFDANRKIAIYTWGRALLKAAPPQAEVNFNAAVLNGRGRGINLKKNNGLSIEIQSQRETLVEEITEDGKINSIVEKKELSAYEKEQDRLKSLPEFQKIRKTAVDTERSTGDRGPEDEDPTITALKKEEDRRLQESKEFTQEVENRQKNERLYEDLIKRQDREDFEAAKRKLLDEEKKAQKKKELGLPDSPNDGSDGTANSKKKNANHAFGGKVAAKLKEDEQEILMAKKHGQNKGTVKAKVLIVKKPANVGSSSRDAQSRSRSRSGRRKKDQDAAAGDKSKLEKTTSGSNSGLFAGYGDDSSDDD